MPTITPVTLKDRLWGMWHQIRDRNIPTESVVFHFTHEVLEILHNDLGLSYDRQDPFAKCKTIFGARIELDTWNHVVLPRPTWSLLNEAKEALIQKAIEGLGTTSVAQSPCERTVTGVDPRAKSVSL
jgi:hypothetical protein